MIWCGRCCGESRFAVHLPPPAGAAPPGAQRRRARPGGRHGAGSRRRSPAGGPQGVAAGTGPQPGGAPYVVFHDRTLVEVAALRPSSTGELAQVSGVGAAKLERYGEAVLAVISTR
ncbi:HRDC domain-containing protein [Cyanobium sp. ATX-6F1]|uniref:HRDC domain-containing protein n=1 Tax=Cyanobium sp. ATX-6F1 TaxID=3137388 RepID=UPI0039BE71D5